MSKAQKYPSLYIPGFNNVGTISIPSFWAKNEPGVTVTKQNVSIGRSEVVSLDSLQRIADFICAKNGYWAEIGIKEYTDAMLVFGAISSGTCYTLMNDLGVSYQPAKACSTPKYCTVDISDPELAAANLIRIVDASPPCWCEDGAYQHLIA
jgi:hypothetical protein